MVGTRQEEPLRPGTKAVAQPRCRRRDAQAQVVLDQPSVITYTEISIVSQILSRLVEAKETKTQAASTAAAAANGARLWTVAVIR